MLSLSNHVSGWMEGRNVMAAQVAAVAVVMQVCSSGFAQECGQGWYPFVVGPNVGVDGVVRAMTVWNGQLVIGGSFTVAGGTQVNGIARWEGSAWHPISSGGQIGMNGVVFALTVWNGDVIAGGSFTTAGGQTVNRIARWDGSAWHPLTSGGQVGVNDQVDSLTVWNGDLIAGGVFTTAGGQTVNRIAQWDGEKWHHLNSGGQTGVTDTGGTIFTPSVNTLAVWNGDLIVGGFFNQAGGQTVNRIARWDGEEWHTLTSGNQIGFAYSGSGPANTHALTVWNGDLIAGGRFTTAGGQTVNHIARWDGSQWHPFTSGGQVGVSGSQLNVVALAVWNDDLIAGGLFNQAGEQTVNRIARWTSTSWEPFTYNGQTGMGISSPDVRALKLFNGDLIAGGQFTTAGNQTVNRIAGWGITDGGDQFWVGPEGGTGSGLYQNTDHWLCGLIPGNFATVFFDHDVMPLPPAYTVSLGSQGGTRRFIVNTDEVTLNLTNQNFFLSAAHDDPLPSLIIGQYPEEDARFIVRNTLLLPRRLNATSISIGDGEDSIGRLTVRNTSTTSPISAGMTADGNVTVGRLGQGTLIVENRADLDYGRFGSHLRIGDAGHGALTVRTGGFFASDDFIDTATIGRQAGATGNVLVDGSGSFWIGASNDFFIGESGDATLTISNGGALYSATLNQLHIARNAGSTASVTVKDPGSIWFEGIQPITIGSQGDGSLNVLDGGIIETANVNILRRGAITGNSFLFSDVLNLGEVLPGIAATQGVLTIDGNYRQIGPPPGGSVDESGQLRVRVGGDALAGASSDQLIVTGTAELGGGLFIELMDGYQPQAGEMFSVLSASSIDPQHQRFDVAFMPGLPAQDGQQPFMRVAYGGGVAGEGGVAGVQGATVVVDVFDYLLGFEDPFDQAVDGSPSAVIVGDFDNNGSLDLAIALDGSPGSVLALYNDGTGAFVDTLQVPVGVQPSAITMGDFTNNGFLDLAVTNRGSNNVSILSNTGTEFSSGGAVSVGLQPSAIDAADLHTRGAIDLVVANEGSNNIMILENSGSGAFALSSTVMVGNAPSAISIEDIEGTKAPGIVVANRGSNSVSILSANGAGVYAVAQTHSVGAEPIALSIEDIEGTKAPGIVTANRGGSISVLRNLGGGVFAPQVSIPMGGKPLAMTAFDMDNDGDPDFAIVVDDPEVGSVVRILRNDSPGSDQIVLTHHEDLAQGEGAVLVASGDVLDDGADDLITINALSGGGGVASTNSEGGIAGEGNGRSAGSVAIRPNVLGKPVPVSCPGDINGDAVVNGFDLVELLACWGRLTPGCEAADINGDTLVNGFDLVELLSNWGPCP